MAVRQQLTVPRNINEGHLKLLQIMYRKVKYGSWFLSIFTLIWRSGPYIWLIFCFVYITNPLMALTYPEDIQGYQGWTHDLIVQITTNSYTTFQIWIYIICHHILIPWCRKWPSSYNIQTRVASGQSNPEDLKLHTRHLGAQATKLPSREFTQILVSSGQIIRYSETYSGLLSILCSICSINALTLGAFVLNFP